MCRNLVGIKEDRRRGEEDEKEKRRRRREEEKEKKKTRAGTAGVDVVRARGVASCAREVARRARSVARCARDVARRYPGAWWGIPVNNMSNSE